MKEHHAAVEKAIQDSTSDGIIVIADETTDSADNAVMAVSVVTTSTLFLLGVESLGTGEHDGVGYANAVMHVWGRYNLEGNAMRRFVTDNDAKWNRAWRVVNTIVDGKPGGGLCTLWPYAKRQHCFCHVLNLVMETLEEHPAVQKLAMLIKMLQRLVSGVHRVRNGQRRHRM